MYLISATQFNERLTKINIKFNKYMILKYKFEILSIFFYPLESGYNPRQIVKKL
jgi:hypothetical protein